MTTFKEMLDEKGNTFFRVTELMVTKVDELVEGVSSVSGQPWAIRNINVRCTDINPDHHSNYMRLTLRGQLAKDSANLVAGSSLLTVDLRLMVRGTRYLQNDVIVSNYSETTL